MTYITKTVLKAKREAETDKKFSLLKRIINLIEAKNKVNAKEARSDLDKILAEGAKNKLSDVLEEEVESYLERQRYEHQPKEKAKGYRNGYGKERKLCTGRGTITIQAPRVRDTNEPFHSEILKPYQLQTPEVVELLPDLYLHGLSTGDFEIVLRYYLGEGAALSPASIVRLKQKWAKEYEDWCKRPLKSAYAYVWADGIFLKVGLCKDKLAILVVLGVNEDGKKEILAAIPGYRENESNWREVFRSLMARGVEEIKLLIGDGIAALWSVVDEFYPNTVHQRCWRHKIVNVLSKVPKSMEDEVLKDLHTIYYATTKDAAIGGFVKFSEKYHKYSMAVKCLLENQKELTAYFDFPKKHWASLKTTNPIESIFSPIRSRLVVAKRIVNHYSALGLFHQLLLQRELRFYRLASPHLAANVIAGVVYRNGKEVKE